MPAQQQRLLQPSHPVTVGYCIYCGANEGELSKEHVVALALGGTVILLKASCSECAAVTSKFEHFVARRHLGPFRIRSDQPTRHPDQRPTLLPLGLIDADGGRREVEVPSSEHPSTLILPVLAKPKILILPGEERKENFGMISLVPTGSDVGSLPQRHGASAIRLGSFEILSFCQVLAKFAHGAAFAVELDWTVTWEPLLPDLILGKTPDWDTLVGGIYSFENTPKEMGHSVFFESVDIGEERYLIAELRLFAYGGTPIYRVVVGRRK